MIKLTLALVFTVLAILGVVPAFMWLFLIPYWIFFGIQFMYYFVQAAIEDQVHG